MTDDDLIDLREAARHTVFKNPKTGRPAHISAMYRYITRGVRGVNGTRVMLETMLTPFGRKTSRQAIARFVERLNNREPTPPALMPAVRRRAVAAANAKLDAAGV